MLYEVITVGILVFPHVDSCRRLSERLAPSAGPAQIAADPAVQAWFQSLLDALDEPGEGSASRVARGMLLAEPTGNFQSTWCWWPRARRRSARRTSYNFV